MLNTELKYANVNHMVNLFLFGFFAFCFLSMTTLLQLGIYIYIYIRVLLVHKIQEIYGVYIYIYIYIYIRGLLVHRIQEIYGYALLVWWITSIYLYDHVYTPNWSLHHCMKKKTKVTNQPKYSDFITCFMPDRPLDNIKEFLIFWNSKTKLFL